MPTGQSVICATVEVFNYDRQQNGIVSKRDLELAHSMEFPFQL